MRIFALIVTIIITLPFSLSCGTGDNKEGLTFWVTMGADETASIKVIASRFFDETGIAVEVIPVGLFELTTKLELASPAGKGPDIVTISHTSVGSLALMGLLSPIVVSEELSVDLETYPAPLVSAFEYENRLYGIPLTVESYGLVVNEDLIGEIPETWEELIDKGLELTRDTNGDGEPDVYGFLTDPLNFYFTFPLYDAFGAYIFGVDENGDVDSSDIGFCTPGGINALNLLTGLTGSEKLIPRGIDYPVISDLFAKGRVAMMIHGTYLIPYYRSLGITVGYYPLPPMEDGRLGRPLSTLMGIGISAHSKEREKALMFLSFLLSPDNLRVYFEASGGHKVMADPGVYREADFDEERTLTTSMAIAMASYPYPNDPAGDLIWDAVTDATSLVLSGSATPEEALCEMQARLELIIEEMKR